MIFEELRELQHKHGYLPAGELVSLSARSGVALNQIHTVASFYPHFRMSPPAKADVRVCDDMSCHLRGAGELRAGLESRFRGAAAGDISFRDVSCLGRCDSAPAISINDRIYSGVTGAQCDAMLKDLLQGTPLPPVIEKHVPVPLGSDPYPPTARYGVLRKILETRDWLGALATLKASDLRGLGGAGFPTGSKWDYVRNAPGDEKYVVCNADESEPGTIKDRFIMRHIPHMVIEGMILAGVITGAKKGILYIRHEYQAQEKILHQEIQHCYQQGLLGANIAGSGITFDLEIFVSPGGYICGEETALIEAIEGKRSEPRNKPPFPVTHGLWNKPTVLNNVETFSNVPLILEKGVEWFKAQGQEGATGLKFVGVSGHVVRPGVYEVPMGIRASEVILGLAGGVPDGKKLKAWAPSGPSSGYLPASMLDVRLDFKSLAAAGSMLGSGAIVVCNEDTCALDMALNAVRFFRNESCGKCVPCRVGSQKMVDILTGWTEGKGVEADMSLLDDLADAMKLTSICGLGQVVPVPIASVVKHFREEIDDHILRHRCPTGVCPTGR